ncbi:hypothetical protein J1N35_015328, partial [Gossypium stocksii]
GEDFNNLDLDELLDDINDEGMDEGENVHTPSVGNLSRGIVILNDLEAYMLNVDPNGTHELEFPKYQDIIPSH